MNEGRFTLDQSRKLVYKFKAGFMEEQVPPSWLCIKYWAETIKTRQGPYGRRHKQTVMTTLKQHVNLWAHQISTHAAMCHINSVARGQLANYSPKPIVVYGSALFDHYFVNAVGQGHCMHCFLL